VGFDSGLLAAMAVAVVLDKPCSDRFRVASNLSDSSLFSSSHDRV
jgi:hypothetical protein